MNFFNTLNYSSCNEDGWAELRALDVARGDDVCCITGSGDRALHMLLGDPSRVLAFDMNPAQNFLLELKIAAIREFDYPTYAGFLGLFASREPRLDVYARLRPLFSEDAARWWDARLGMLDGSVLYAGRWERFFQMTSRSLQAWRGRKIRRLFAFDDLDEQRAFVRREWDTRAWRLSLRATLNPWTLRFAFGDPGFYRNARSAIPAWRYMHDRLNAFLERHPARSSFMLALVLHGAFFDPLHYPPYLREECFATLKERVDRVTIRTAPLFEMLASEESRSCNKYSLSDVSSFLNADEYRSLLEFFDRKKGVRFCLRDFLTHRGIPPDCETRNVRFLTALQESLAADDASLGYTFIIGEHR